MVYKKYKKRAITLIGTGIIAGVGARAVTQAGGNAGGINAFSGMMPTVGTAMGAGMALDSLQSLGYKKKRRK